VAVVLVRLLFPVCWELLVLMASLLAESALLGLRLRQQVLSLGLLGALVRLVGLEVVVIPAVLVIPVGLVGLVVSAGLVVLVGLVVPQMWLAVPLVTVATVVLVVPVVSAVLVVSVRLELWV